jgi:hypothetical protein
LFKSWIVIAALAVVLALAGGCRRGESVRTDSIGTAAEAVAGSIYSPDAGRAEALLKAANVPYVLRYDLAHKNLPAGCTWHAAYATQNPEVVLEVFAFADADAVRTYMTERNGAFDALRPPRAHMAVANGILLLVAHYDPRDRGPAKYETLSKFVAAFAP